MTTKQEMELKSIIKTMADELAMTKRKLAFAEQENKLLRDMVSACLGDGMYDVI